MSPTFRLVSAAFVCLAGVASAALSVQDGIFPTTDPGWSGTGNWNRVTLAGTPMLAVEADNLTPYYNAAGGNPASQATTFLELTDWIPGGIYEVTFDSATTLGYQITGEPSPIITLNPGGIQVVINGVAAGTPQSASGIWLVDPADGNTFGSALGAFSTSTVRFTVPQTTTATLGFRGVEMPGDSPSVSVPNARILIDHVSIVLIAVPEPSAAILSLPAALLLLRRRRS